MEPRTPETSLLVRATRYARVRDETEANTLMTALWSTAGVDIPLELSEAFDADRVVFFCGAGVSVPSPSDLPNFKKLAEQIVHDLGRVEHIADDTALDVVLGKMDRLGGRVHLRAEEILSQSIYPNPLHEHILAVGSTRTLRVVTTNFDTHFERAAEKQSITVNVSTAPALPLGDSFEGLVHIHGRLPLAKNEQLVLTDADFGEAYIARGWATQFLAELFKKYTVVFIGYSAKDTVMRYLTRAIADRSSLYALVAADSDQSSWSELDVVPLPYPNPNGDHDKLRELFASWSGRLRLDAVSRLNAAREVAANPAGASARRDDLQWILNDEELRNHFISYASAPDWAPLLSSMGMLERLCMITDTTNTERSGQFWNFASWLVSTIDSDDGETLVALIAKHDGRLSHELWFHTWLKLTSLDHFSLHTRQLVALTIDARGVGDDGRRGMLVANLVESDPTYAKIMLASIATPRRTFEVKKNWYSQAEYVDVSLRYPTLRHVAEESLPGLTNDSEISDRFLLALSSALSTHEVETALLNGAVAPNDISRRRSKIGADESHGSNASIGWIVSLVRDLLRQKAMDDDLSLIRNFLEDDAEIVRRIGFDAIAIANVRHASEFIELLVSKIVVFDSYSRPEVFAVLSNHFPHASLSSRKSLIQFIIQSQHYQERPLEVGVREKLNVLRWLSRFAPDDSLVAEAIAAIAPENNTFVDRVHPELGMPPVQFEPEPSYEPSGDYLDRTPKQVVWRMKRDPRLKDDSWDEDQPRAELVLYLNANRTAAPLVLAECVRQSLWHQTIWNAAISFMTDDNWSTSLASFIGAHPAPGPLAPTIVASLTREIDSASIGVLKERLSSAFRVWKLMPPAGSQEPTPSRFEVDWDPRSSIARAVMDLIWGTARKRSSHKVTVRELNMIKSMVSDSYPSGDASIAVVARSSQYLAINAPAWFNQTLVPLLLGWDVRARQGWRGLVQACSWNPALHEYLGDALRVRFSWFVETHPEFSEDYLQLHAGVFFWYVDDDLAWPDAIYTALDEDGRASWLRHLADGRGSDIPDFARDEKLLSHWQRRLRGLPGPLSSIEQGALLSWLSMNPSNFAQMANCFAAGPAIAGAAHAFDGAHWPLEDSAEASGEALLRILTSDLSLPHFVELIERQADAVSQSAPALALRMYTELLRRGVPTVSERIERLRAQDATAT